MLPKELFFKYSDMYWGTESEVCVGEDVKLIIESGDGLNFEEIKDKTEFRILNFNNELVATFPLVKEDGTLEYDWEIEENKLIGKLNLNTTELVDIFKGFGSIPIGLPFIATLDVLKDNEKTSVFNTQIKLTHWQRVTMPEDTVSVYSYKTYLEHLIEENKKYLEGKIDEHVNDKDNPHEVTAEQIGAATKNYVDAGLTYQASVIKKDISDAIGEVDKKIEENKEDVSEEISRIDNLYFTSKNEVAEIRGEISSVDEELSRINETIDSLDNKLVESVKNVFYWKGTVDVLPKKWDGDPEEIPEGYVIDLKQGDVYRLSSDGVEYFYDQPDDSHEVEGHWEPLGFDPIEGLKNSVAFKGVLSNKEELGTITDPPPNHGDMYYLKYERSIAIYNTQFFSESEGGEREPGWLITQGDVNSGDVYFDLILEPLKVFLAEYEGFVKLDTLATLLKNQKGVLIGTDYWNSISEEDGYTNENLKENVEWMPGGIKIGSGNYEAIKETGVAIGGGASAYYGSVAIGHPAIANGENSIAIGMNSVVDDGVTDNGIAIGHGAKVYAANAVQIGNGENHITNSLKFFDKVIADLNGKTFLLPVMPAISIGGTSETDSIDGTEEKEEAMIAIGSDATASGSSSIAIGGTYKIEDGDGFNSEEDVFSNTSVVGFGSTAIGQSVEVEGNCSTAVGFGNSLKCNNSVALGKHLSSESDYTVLIGDESELGEESSCSIVIGSKIESSGFENVAVGHQAKALGHCATAIGTHAKATALNSVQLGEGENNNEGSLQFRSYPLVDKDGKIPPERISITAEQIGAYTKEEVDEKITGNNKGGLGWADDIGTYDETTNTQTLKLDDCPYYTIIDMRNNTLIKISDLGVCYKGEFIIATTKVESEEELDTTITFKKNLGTTATWVGDIPTFELGKQYLVAYVFIPEGRNLLLNHYHTIEEV